jgi:hypothetical protein
MIVRPKIERYAEEHTSPPSPLLAEVAAATASAMDRPEMMVGVLEGALLAMLRPQRILEIGTFTGYSALSMAEAMPAGCRIVTLEADARPAAFARRRTAASPYAYRIEVREGPALNTLPELTGPFDLVSSMRTSRPTSGISTPCSPCLASAASSPSTTCCSSPSPPTPRTLRPSKPSTLTSRAAPTSSR